MKWQVQTESFADSLLRVAKAAGNGANSPYDAGVYIKASEGKLTLNCMESSVFVDTIVKATVEESGEGVISASFLSEALKRFTADNLTVTVENNVWNVACGKAKYTVSGMDPAEFTTTPNVVAERTIKMKAAAMLEMILGTDFAASKNLDKPIMMGCFLDFSDDGKKAKMVGLDGFRIAVSEIAADITAKNDDLTPVILPAKNLQKLRNYLEENSEGEIEIKLSEKTAEILLSPGDGKAPIRFVTSLVQGKFPDYANFIPKESACEYAVEKAALVKMAERASLVIMNETMRAPIIFELQDGAIKATCETTAGKAEDFVDAKLVNGASGGKVALNHKYLLESLRHINGDIVTLKFGDERTPVLISQKEAGKIEQTSLIMPVRII